MIFNEVCNRVNAMSSLKSPVSSYSSNAVPTSRTRRATYSLRSFGSVTALSKPGTSATSSRILSLLSSDIRRPSHPADVPRCVAPCDPRSRWEPSNPSSPCCADSVPRQLRCCTRCRRDNGRRGRHLRLRPPQPFSTCCPLRPSRPIHPGNDMLCHPPYWPAENASHM